MLKSIIYEIQLSLWELGSKSELTEEKNSMSLEVGLLVLIIQSEEQKIIVKQEMSRASGAYTTSTIPTYA